LRAVTPEAVVERAVALRRERWTGKQIASACGISSVTVSRILRRIA
jgi:transcriptional regulator with XRE-family HTH domain